MPRRLVRVYLSRPGIKWRPIAYCRTGPQAFGSCTIVHNASLLWFAQHHVGRLNVNLTWFAPRFKARYEAGVSFSYFRSVALGIQKVRGVPNSITWHVRKDVKDKGYLDPNSSTEPPLHIGEDVTVQVPLARIEASPHMQTIYQMQADKTTTVTIGFGLTAPNGATESGSASTTKSSGLVENYIRQYANSSTQIYRNGKLSWNRECGVVAVPPGQQPKGTQPNDIHYRWVVSCNMVDDLVMIGTGHQKRAPYHSCTIWSQGPDSQEWWWAPYDEPLSKEKDRGVAFGAEQQGGFGLNFVKLATTYGEEDKTYFYFHWAGTHKGDGIALCGTTQNWLDASYVLVQYQSASEKAQLTPEQRFNEGLPPLNAAKN